MQKPQDQKSRALWTEPGASHLLLMLFIFPPILKTIITRKKKTVNATQNKTNGQKDRFLCKFSKILFNYKNIYYLQEAFLFLSYNSTLCLPCNFYTYLSFCLFCLPYSFCKLVEEMTMIHSHLHLPLLHNTRPGR